MAKRPREWSLDDLEGWKVRKPKKERKVPFEQPEAISGQDDCSFCLEPLNGAIKEVTLPCRHKFHKDCIGKWFMSDTAKNEGPRCGLCKALVTRAIVHYCWIKKAPAVLESPTDQWHFDATVKRGKVTYSKHYSVMKLTDSEIGVLRLDMQRSEVTEKKLLLLQANLHFMPQARRNKWEGLQGRVIRTLSERGTSMTIL